MIRAKHFVFLVPLGLVFLLSAFHSSSRLFSFAASDTISFTKPKNFPGPVFNFKANPVTPDGFTLGKTLFYDPNLSADGTVSCGSCHQSSAAFANLGSAVSSGVKACKGKRNAPPLFNLAWQKEFMWDGRINTMQGVPVNALTDPCEMGNTMSNVLASIQRDRSYPLLFKKAFGRPTITQEDVLKALAQFTVMMVSANSKYDKYIRREQGIVFSADEQAGYTLFKQKCSECHREPLFTDLSYRNNGLEETSVDFGRDSLTHLKTDLGKFRVPTLRNIEITGPYMHDGRFISLKQVMQHYNEGMKNHANLDALFKQKGKNGIHLFPTEQSQVIAFLKTLTDIDLINDRRFNNN